MSDSLRSTTKAFHRPRRTALVVFALVKNTIHRVGRVLGATTTFARVAEVPFATASHVLRAALALALLAMAIQVAWIARHLSSPARPGSPARLAVGGTVRFLNGTTEDGERTQIRLASSQGGATIVYAFHPECRLGDAVAPEWAKRFGAPVGSGMRRIAVSRARPAAAAAYGKGAGWQVEVISVAQLEPTAQGRLLASRTPWVFVFDSSGVLRYDGHGDDLGGAERALRALPQRHSSHLGQ